MNFLIVTHVVHTQKGNDFFAYSPYVNEMNIWLKHVDKVTIIAPLKKLNIDAIHQKYNHNNIEFIEVPEFSLTSTKELLKSIFVVPFIFFKIFWAMISSNHVHLRCPGNMGFIGCFVQILFPWKSKSAKYAGNWDSKSKQPLSYRIQKKILTNTILTHNIKVLVYGEWEHQTRNIKSFFTATYFKSEIKEVQPRILSGTIKFLFVGTLSKGKQPLYAIKLVQELKKRNYETELSLYGTGAETTAIEDYIEAEKLNNYVFLKGNADRETMKEVYQKSHFIILPSKSEGWPKVIAEGMFWGCLPIATKVSCVPNMLNYGERGILLEESFSEDIDNIEKVVKNQEDYNNKIFNGIMWSHNFTIDKFDNEIKKIINS